MRQALLAAVALLSMNGVALAQPAAPATVPAAIPAASPSPAPDYADPAAWLCLPGRADACAADLTTTVVAADGTLTRETFSANPDAPIDCFYVYPTVSNDRTPNSDMTANSEETFVVAQQFARFGSKCRLFAPLYRQITLTALRQFTLGIPVNADRAMAYGDVLAAWKYYLAHQNTGRGVVLVGHSQGSGIIARLLAEEIDGKPDQAKLVSAIIPGANVAVPRGARVGGLLKSIPTCATADETGCLISYVSFRDTAPPPQSARFGTTQMNTPLPLPAGADLTAACVNPAALLHGGSTAPLHAYLSSRAYGVGAPQPVWAMGKSVDTPFVSIPGLLTATCAATPTHTYLSIHTNGDPADPRTDTIAGDVVVTGRVLPDWGLHLIDVNEAMGDLVEVVGREAAAYGAQK